MKIRIITIGKVKEPWIQEGIAEYQKRLQRYVKVELLVLKDQGIEKEAKDILSRIKDECLIVLSEEGRFMSSVELSGFLKKPDKDMVFIIGSPDGLTQEVKARADMMLSLSRMTFTHELSQLILFEQLYRGFSILRNEKYHRA